MRVALLGLAFWIATLAAAPAQQFDTPLDLVETLYNSYFDASPVDDFSPYLSDNLTRKMAGSVGTSEFIALGFDPIVSDPQWEPRNFKATTVRQTEQSAEVDVRFETHGTPVSLKITLIREPAHGWQIDHLAGTAGDRSWCTNDIIALNPAKDPAEPLPETEPRR